MDDQSSIGGTMTHDAPTFQQPPNWHPEASGYRAPPPGPPPVYAPPDESGSPRAKPPRSRSTWIIVIAIAIAAVVAVVAVQSFKAGSDVTYTVTGTGVNPGGTADAGTITYSSSQGQQQLSSVALPWTATVKDSSPVIVAQAGQDASSITCAIRSSGGKVLATQTSSGQFAVVTCTGR